MAEWATHQVGKLPDIRKPILVTGLPGIGNVGKIAVDFLVDELKAKKIKFFTSHSFPHCVFINEENTVDLPSVSLHYFRMKKSNRDILFLAGDIQPIDERSCYEFCEMLAEMMKKYPGAEIITLGGIGLAEVPKKPKVYLTGWDAKHIENFKKSTPVETKLYGIVGPIIGVSGVLLGMAKIYEMPAVGLLAETYAHPLYFGVGGAREILTVLQRKLELGINISKLEKEIREVEKEALKRAQALEKVTKQSALQKMKDTVEDMDYIG
jgi:uncharacterized protein